MSFIRRKIGCRIQYRIRFVLLHLGAAACQRKNANAPADQYVIRHRIFVQRSQTDFKSRTRLKFYRLEECDPRAALSIRREQVAAIAAGRVNNL